MSDSEILQIVEDLLKSAPPATAQKSASTEPAASDTPRAPPSQPAPPKRVVRTIVVDAGHGGEDPGAIGYRGYREKDVTLRLAKKLKKRLYARLGVRVVLTRSRDESLPLEKRTAIANAAVRNEDTDLFISLHANASKSAKAYGIETYFLNNTTDQAALRLASFENGDRGARPTFTSPDAFMFADLTQNYKAEVSSRLAGYVQESLVRNLARTHARGAVKDLGVKHAVFFVLMGARVPSVLVEAGFITNPAEAKRLNSDAYLDDLADAITTGVANFIQANERGAMTTL